MRRRTAWALAAGAVLAGAGIMGMMAMPRGPQSVPTAVATAPASAAASRISYPADQAPRVSLSGGRTERVRSVLNITRRLKYGDSVWDEANVPDGPVWVRVDLDHQVLSVFRAGHEIGTAVILYGIRDKESPAGTFPVLQKAADYHSITYDAPMPWMLRLTADGVAIHGANVRRGAATHGCIGVPTAFARRLFDTVKLGDPVLIVTSAGKT